MILSLCIDNSICGLDFSPLGTTVASIDQDGVCLISDLISHDYKYHVKTESESGFSNPSYSVL